MTAKVKVFGCRPLTTVLRPGAAGIRKPPREETAGDGALAVGWLELWRFERRACGVEVGWTGSVRRVGKMGKGDGSGSEGAGAVER